MLMSCLISGSLCPAGRSFLSGWFVRRERCHREHRYELAPLWRVSHCHLRKQACWCCVDSSATSPPTGLIIVMPFQCMMALSDDDDTGSWRARNQKRLCLSVPHTSQISSQLGLFKGSKASFLLWGEFAKCQKFSSNHQCNHCAPRYHLFILNFLSCIVV